MSNIQPQPLSKNEKPTIGVDGDDSTIGKEETVKFVLTSNDGNNSEDEEKEDIDFIFNHIVGGGDGADWGQWIVLGAIIPVGLCAGFPLFMHLFACYEARHRCYISNCDSLNSTVLDFDAEFISFAIPTNHTYAEMLKIDELFDPCHRYSSKIGGNCEPDSFNQTNIQKCDKLVYDTSVVEESFATKFNLVCDMESMQLILGVMVMLGLTVGSEVGGRLSDKFGRKLVMIFSVVVIVPTVMFAGYSKDFWTYAILKFICTAALPCIWFSSHSLIIEIFGKDYRKNAVVARELIWPFGGVGLVLVFYLTRHWTYFHLWTGALCSIALPALLIIPESPRWLITNGKFKQARHTLLKIARWNRRTLSDEQKEKIDLILRRIEQSFDVKHEKKLGFMHMMNVKNRKKTLIIMLNWIILCVTCFFLALNVTKLSGNVFLNFALLALIGDLPGKVAVAVTLKYFSRRLNLFLAQFLAGLFCIIVAFLPKNYNLALLTFYLLAMDCSYAGFTLVYLITGELYPTNLRSQAIGTCSMVSRVFGISVPFISKLTTIWKPMPMLVIGIPSMCIACLVYFLPETKQTNLPQTMNESEHINVKGNKQ